ncbi:MAG: hypothetical protein LBL00_03850 [Endomicrobium sp.]|jgi:hypothetical protein|nr:hypothetical protein [Endomicrobium sp.]
MSSLFSAPSMPKIQEIPRTPVVDEGKKLQEEEIRAAKRKGRASTILSDFNSRRQQTSSSAASKTLLGE